MEAVCVALTGSAEVTEQPRLAEKWRGWPVFVVGKATAQAGEGAWNPLKCIFKIKTA